MAGTVTATQGGSTSSGISMAVKVITGQSASQPGNTAGTTTTTSQSIAITPTNSGSFVYASILGVGGTWSALANTTNTEFNGGAGLEFCECRLTATSTGGTGVTFGYSTTGAAGISASACEINNSTGLAEDASAPAASGFTSATTVTSASFTPPAGSLLVVMVESNGGAAATTMAISDTFGLGLTWTERVKQNTAGDGYSGIWTALVPAGANAGLAASSGAVAAAAGALTIGMTIRGS